MASGRATNLVGVLVLAGVLTRVSGGLLILIGLLGFFYDLAPKL